MHGRLLFVFEIFDPKPADWGLPAGYPADSAILCSCDCVKWPPDQYRSEIFYNPGEFEPKTLGPLPHEKAGYPYHNVSQTLDDGDHEGGFYRQPHQLANQNQGDFLYPESTRNKKAGTSANHA